MERPGDNYPDSKCAWGYMTVCDDCRAKWLQDKPRSYDHVDIRVPLDGDNHAFPVTECEVCGRSCDRIST